MRDKIFLLNLRVEYIWIGVAREEKEKEKIGELKPVINLYYPPHLLAEVLEFFHQFELGPRDIKVGFELKKDIADLVVLFVLEREIANRKRLIIFSAEAYIPVKGIEIFIEQFKKTGFYQINIVVPRDEKDESVQEVLWSCKMTEIKESLPKLELE